jgi:exodeoxyribonuclease VII small subunit
MNKSKESYEELIKRLEEIVSTFDKEELTLDKSMKIYEEGVSISNKLYKILNEAEGKIKILTNEGEKVFLSNGEKS